jgi:hypothetical protein
VFNLTGPAQALTMAGRLEAARRPQSGLARGLARPAGCRRRLKGGRSSAATTVRSGAAALRRKRMSARAAAA